MELHKKIRRIPLIAPLVISAHSATLVIMVFMCLTCSFCFAQNQERFYCEDGHFSFIPPDGWQVLSEKGMTGKLKNKLYWIRRELGHDTASGVLMAVCKLQKERINKHRVIWIERLYYHKKSDFDVENDWLSEKYRKKKTKRLYSKKRLGINKNTDIKIEDAKCFYEQGIHAAFEEVIVEIDSIGFTRVTATLLGCRNKTTLFCQFQNSDNIDAPKLISQIAESFKHDPDYEFGAPYGQRIDSEEVARDRRKGVVIPFFIFSSVMFLCLFIYRMISGEHIPLLAIITASISGILVSELAGWLIWQALSIARYGWYGHLPSLIATSVMVPIIWKWPGSEIPFLKSVVAVFSGFFLLSLGAGLLIGFAGIGTIVFFPIAIILIIMIIIWRS